MLATRRHFLAASGSTLALATPATAQDIQSLTLATAWPRGAPGVGVNAERFARRVEALSGGRLSIRLFGAGELVPAFEVLDAVQRGTADLGHGTAYYWSGKQQALHYFTGVPFGLTAVEFVAWLRFGGGQALWDKVMAPFGVVPFYAGSSGPQAGGWFRREITSPEDFLGLKFRIAGLGAQVLRRMGTTTVTTPPGEIYGALASGAVDGADWVGPWNDIAFGLHKVAPYYYLPGFHEPGPGLEILVNRKRFEGLAPDLQEVLRSAAEATALETLADFTYHNIRTFAELETTYGVTPRHFPPAVIERLAAESRAVLKALAQRNSLTAKVWESYGAFLDQARAYAPFSELGSLATREAAGSMVRKD
ncbi:MAG: TRAP transporter substrate-binding protein [Pseudomonadota bacterium]